jgi:hypothetical protein
MWGSALRGFSALSIFEQRYMEPIRKMAAPAWKFTIGISGASQP